MKRALGAGLLLLAAYVGLSFLNSPRGFLGTDTGGKVATMKVMAERGRFDPDVGYWAERWDPDGWLHPLANTTRTQSGRWVNVTTLPALWAGWLLYRVGGYRAALLVPMAGSIAAAFAGRELLRRVGVGERHAWTGFWLLGLASPLAIYALDFWEHSLGVALIAWAVVWLLDGRMLIAGLSIGVAATMRTEALVYLAVAGAVVGVQWLFARRAPTAIALAGALLVAGAVLPLVANEAVERKVVGSTVRSGRVAGTAVSGGQMPGERVEEAATTTFGLEGSPLGLALGAGFVLLVAFATRRSDPGIAQFALVGAGALVVVRIATGGLGFVPGVLAASPAAAAGLASVFGRDSAGIPESPGRSRPEVKRAVAAVALAAIPFVVFFQFRGGAAPQWGGRYLLPSGLLLAVLGWAGLSSAAVQRNVLRGVGALAAGVTAFGLVWMSVRTHDIDRAMATLHRRPEPVLVFSPYFLAREGGARYGEKRWLTLSPQGDAPFASSVLQEAGVTTFASVDIAGDRRRTYPGFASGSTTLVRLFDGVDVRVTHWQKGP